jgi:predicted F0F1-ATPase subunit
VYFLAQASEIGFQVAIPISLGAFFGTWVDKKLGTQPLWTLISLLVGILFAFLSLFYTVKVFSQKRK